MVLNLFCRADQLDIALVKFLAALVELPQCLGHELLQEFAQLNGVTVGVIENFEFLLF
jgi:hypothetical protein